MKKVLTAILLIVCGAAAFAQVDTVGRAGTPADTNYYYDTVEYFAPKRNPIYYFGSPFCDHFFELRVILGGGNIGLGAMYTYLPEVWGFNVSASMMDVKYFMLSGGAAYRLSKPWSEYDWHLYGNAGISFDYYGSPRLRPTVEAGVRFASAMGLDKLCMSSGSLGIMTDFNRVYATFGIGLSISAILSIFLLLVR